MSFIHAERAGDNAVDRFWVRSITKSFIRRRAVAGSTGTRGGTPGYVTFAAGSRDGSRLFVVDWNGVGPDAIHAMDEYLDDLLCRH
ncbi:MAG TPA: hypothetical protein VF232_13210 [Gaiellaceae bacterium]